MTVKMRDAVDAYRKLSALGYGWAPTSSDVDDAVHDHVQDGWTVVSDRYSSSDVAVLALGESVRAIGGDSHGGMAWAVDLAYI